MQIRKNKKLELAPAAETKRTTEARLAWAVGTENLTRHDALSHVTEDFRQSFDRIGQHHASAMQSGFLEEEEPQPEAEQKTKQMQPQQQKQQPAEMQQREPENPEKKREKPTSPMTRFSEVAFQRGALSGAVLNGTGKMMLVSCLKRTAQETGPQHLQQQTVTDIGSKAGGIAGHAPDKLIYNPGFANSALGVVTDTLRDARQTVESMAAVARGGSAVSGGDRAAMFKLYPFLDDSRDAALEADYRAKLAACTDEREKPILQNALVQTTALRAKKAQMKNEFINKLRFLSDRATETLAELEAPGILDELIAAAFGPEEPELPENPEEGADGDAPNGKKTGTGKKRKEAAAKRLEKKP